MTAPLKERALDYLAAGWPVLKLPAKRKEYPPTGFTGADGKDADRATVVAWAEAEPNGNVALRMPPDVIGIDVDAYGGKDGGAGLKDLERNLGALPATWWSTSRTDGVSGIRFYRVPTGTVFRDKPKPNIEILQRKHRYAVVWPSVHPEGRTYRWVDPDGFYADRIPTVDELADLPDAWLSALREDTRTILDLPTESPRPKIDRSRAVASALADALSNFYGGRHDAARDGCMALMRLEHQGHPGAAEALEDLRVAFIRTVTSDGTRSEQDAEREWKRMVDGGARRIATEPDKRPKWDELERQPRQTTTIVPKSVPADADWPNPVPLSVEEDPEPFPVDCLPSWMVDHVWSVAIDLQTPPDLPAMLALAALSVACNGSAKVAVRGGWREGLNLYLVVAMPPGSGKSPAFKPILDPLRKWETQRRKLAKPKIEQAESEMRMAEEALRKAEKAQDELGVRDALNRKANIYVPPMPRLFIDDSTPEAMIAVMAAQGGRLAIVSSEGGPFEIMTGRYSERPNLEPYLQSWSGDPITVDRIGRDDISIDEPRLVIGITVQPQVIAAMADKPEMTGRGLTQRFMYSVPPNLVGNRDLTTEWEHDDTTFAVYVDRLTALAERRWKIQEPETLHLSPEAKHLFTEWRQAIEYRRHPDYGDLAPLSEWTMKLESSVIRTAGLLHLAEHDAARGITFDTLQRALRIGTYWLSHAWRVHALWSPNTVIERAERIVKWIIRNGAERFSARELHRAGVLKRVNDSIDVYADPLQTLVDNDYIRGDFEGPVMLGVRGKASPEFVVNPRIRVVGSCRATGVTQPVGHVGHVALEPFQESLTHSDMATEHARIRTPDDMSDMSDNSPESAHPAIAVDNGAAEPDPLPPVNLDF